jgi:hypothetical protein
MSLSEYVYIGAYCCSKQTLAQMAYGYRMAIGLIRKMRLAEMFHGSVDLNQADFMLRLAFGSE